MTTLSLGEASRMDVIYSTILSQHQDIRHFVSGRVGGHSTGRYFSLNLSFNVGDSVEAVLSNRVKFSRQLGFNLKQLTLGQQQHTGNVSVITKEEQGRGGGTMPLSSLGGTDALITNVPGIVLAVLTADCCPVLMFDPVKRVIAAIHSGRMGVVKRIARNTICAMIDQFGSVSQDILVYLGPAISGMNYPISAAAATDLKSILGPYSSSLRCIGEVVHFDLRDALMVQLLVLGVSSENVDRSNADTFSDSARFFSERRDEAPTGRFMSGIQLL